MFDSYGTVENRRLDLMSKILDPCTCASLEALGVGEGWNCFELGGGNGSMTEGLCEKVGASGSVVSLDIEPKTLESIRAENLTVLRGDARTDEFPAGPFDLVLSRAMLHQIAEYAQDVLLKLAAAVKPGGWLFVCEPSFDLVKISEPRAWREAWNGIIKWGLSEGVEWFMGRRLPAMVQSLGLGYPDAKTEVPNIRGTTIDATYFKLFFETTRERVVSSGFVDAATLDAAAAVLDDPERWTQCWMLTSV